MGKTIENIKEILLVFSRPSKPEATLEKAIEATRKAGKSITNKEEEELIRNSQGISWEEFSKDRSNRGKTEQTQTTEIMKTEVEHEQMLIEDEEEQEI